MTEYLKLVKQSGTYKAPQQHCLQSWINYFVCLKCHTNLIFLNIMYLNNLTAGILMWCK